MTADSEKKYVHVSYEPKNGWVLSIMGRLSRSTNAQMREGFGRWSETSLRDLGFAITTRMHMLSLSIHRLNGGVADLRNSLNDDEDQLQNCLDSWICISVAGRSFGLQDFARHGFIHI